MVQYPLHQTLIVARQHAHVVPWLVPHLRFRVQLYAQRGYGAVAAVQVPVAGHLAADDFPVVVLT